MNIAAVVILFQPDADVAQRILSYAPFVKWLYIADNTEDNTISKGVLKGLSRYDHIVYTHDGENKGIAVRLNEAAHIAVNKGFEWVLTMDQDSYFVDNTASDYFNCISQFSGNENVAMFGVQYEHKDVNTKNCTANEVDHLITSGSVLNLVAFQKIGPFDEALFIDKVDHEYCLRAQLNDYKIVQLSNIYLQHSLGKISYGRSLKNFKMTPRVLHSPLRMYYIIRNYFYLKSKYKGQFEKSFSEMKEELWIRSKNNFLYGAQKGTLLKYLLKGYMDYKKRRMGKLI